MRFFCPGLIFLLFFHIAGEETCEAYAMLPVFIEGGLGTDTFYKYEIRVILTIKT